ncbi:MAG: hypothetical protein ABH919_02630 [bacterium]
MNNFYLSKHFLRQLKPLIKKYRRLKNDLISVLKNFDKETSIALGNNLYKIRIKNSNIRKGKNKSFRLIVFVWQNKNTLVPIVIYFKGDKENISKKELVYHVSVILNEIKNQ